MKIFVTYVQNGKLRDYEHSYVPMVQDEIQRFGGERDLIWEKDPARADVIILWEGFEYKTIDYISVLENDPTLRQHADRCYAINYDDHPEGFLPGLYTSLERPFFNAAIHRIWPFMLMNNPMVYNLTWNEVMQAPPKLLFSFTGAASHAVRKRLFGLYAGKTGNFPVEHINKWYNHGEAERKRFIDIALDSAFCLCPHGYCSYTPRITEIMAMGRVPVVIADDWIPFAFEDNISYYIRVAERDIEHLPDILSQRAREAEEIGRSARLLWEKYFSPNRRVVAALECIVQLSQLAPRFSFEELRARWRSPEFLDALGWTRRRQFALRVEQHLRRRFPNARVPGVTDLMRYRNAPNLA
jgi:hypothetical protein